MKELLSKLGCPFLEMLGVTSVSELSFNKFWKTCLYMMLPLEMGAMSKHKMLHRHYGRLKAPEF